MPVVYLGGGLRNMDGGVGDEAGKEGSQHGVHDRAGSRCGQRELRELWEPSIPLEGEGALEGCFQGMNSLILLSCPCMFEHILTARKKASGSVACILSGLPSGM